jgi:prophage DNA circulation protein
MTDAFNEAAEVAADASQAGVYMATITLQARVIKHLSDQDRVLPRVVNYSFQQTMPAPTLSNRVYGTGERYLELAKENKVIHPAFMPLTGRMLAV